MTKSDVIEFFNNAASEWDARNTRKDETIQKILDLAGVHAGKDILDVACGTGVVIPDYLARNVKSVTAIDISPEMVKIAQKKFPQEQVSIICGDVETITFDKMFDCIVVYNAFPHFPEPEKLIRTLSSHLKTGGTLTVAHGISRDRINECHRGPANKVSVELLTVEKLASIFEPELKVIVQISDDNMYQVTGIK